MALLEVRDVTLRFGGIVALDGVSFEVEEGHISGLIGPNGAGKTTAFNVITRLYKPDSGEVTLDGKSILRQPAYRIVGKGIARTFQNIQLFKTMSVLENVLIGAHGRGRKVGETEAFEVLDVVGLRDRAYFPAAALPYGIQKRVELARALVAKPRLLLLDEPAGGLNHEEVADLGVFIQRIRDDFALTVLLVEHHMNLVMSISDHVNVLSFGRKIADGAPAQVQADPAVIEAYLGSDDDEHEGEAVLEGEVRPVGSDPGLTHPPAGGVRPAGSDPGLTHPPAGGVRPVGSDPGLTHPPAGGVGSVGSDPWLTHPPAGGVGSVGSDPGPTDSPAGGVASHESDPEPRDDA